MIKVDVISGFLGAGKTTLIKKLYGNVFKKEKVALIENEFGEIGIDSKFLQGSGVNIKEINSGCICCSLVGSFAESMKEIVDTYAPDRVIIEPSGVGKLSDIVKAVEGVECDLKLNIVATVVDAGKVKMYRKNFGEFYDDQIKQANTVIMSKVDKVSQEKIEESFAIIREMNETAMIVTTPVTEDNGEKILLSLEDSVNLLEKLFALIKSEHHHHHEHEHEDEECCCGHHHHEHEHEDEECCCGHHHHEHEHHHHHADEVFASWGKETVKAYSKPELESILDTLANSENVGEILRSKGILKASDSENWYYFDFVAGDWEIREGEPDIVGRAVVIGSHLNEAEIEKIFLK